MSKEEKIKSYPDSIETRVALLESSISHINDSLNRIDRRFDKVDKQFDDAIKEMKTDFRFILVAMAGLAAIMAHGFHWF